MDVRKLFCVLWVAALAVSWSAAQGAPLSPLELEFFEKRVRPLLTDHCFQCHAATSEKLKGGLALDTAEGLLAGGVSGPAIVPGKPEQSLLIKAVRGTDADMLMPPKKKLTEEQIAVLVQWVKMGAPDPRQGSDAGPRVGQWTLEEGRKFWAFVPVKQPVVPSVKDVNWPRGDLDRFVLAALDAKNLKPVRDADPYALVRRVYFDLVGLPPSPSEVDAFVNAWQQEQRQGATGNRVPRVYEQLVDRLLASPQFGERWGRHWLDVVRFAESTGMTRNYPYPHAWRYRDYVIDSFNNDKPYNQFVLEQIAGDLLPERAGMTAKQRDDQRIATGFLALGPKDLNERNALQFTMDNVDEQIDVLSRAMLGLTVSCARCHDHKFDPIPTADYYALAGIFRSTQMLSGYASRQGGGNKLEASNLLALGTDAMPPRVASSADAPTDSAADAKAATLRKELASIKQQIKKVEANKQTLKPGKAKGKDQDNDGKGDKAEAREANLSKKLVDLRMQLAVVESQLDKVPQARAAAPKKGTNETDAKSADAAKAYAMGVREGTATNSVIYLRGEVDKPGKTVERGFLQVLLHGAAPASIPASASGRLQLAQWIASPEHPMTARVMVNRIWQHLFGAGIVASVDNFGVTGEKPSNAALLDYLAFRFAQGQAASPWSIKAMIREVMLSRTYQLSVDFNESNFNIDSENRRVWRQNRRRLEVEAMRDAMLHIASELNLSRPVASPVAKFAIGEINNTRKGGTTLGEVDGSTRRSVYMPIIRSGLPGIYELFDFAEPSMVTGQRDVTTVATQALFMLNSPFVLGQSKRMASRLLAVNSLDDAGRIDLAYRQTLGRGATSQERERSLSFIRNHNQSDVAQGWTAFCQALFASAEFRYLN